MSGVQGCVPSGVPIVGGWRRGQGGWFCATGGLTRRAERIAHR